MFKFLSRYWWVLVLRGVFAVLLGVFAFTWPLQTITALVLAFGVVALADGFLALGMAIAGRRFAVDRWVLALQGLLGIGVGVLTVLHPAIAAGAFVILMSVWAIGLGVLQIVAAVKLRADVPGVWWLVLGGIVGVAFGALFLRHPAEGAIAILWLIGAYALLWGAMLIIGGFELLRLSRRAPAQVGERSSNWQATGRKA